MWYTYYREVLFNTPNSSRPVSPVEMHDHFSNIEAIAISIHIPS